MGSSPTSGTEIFMIRRYKPRQVRVFDWSPDIAYVVGLIATDGCLSGDGRHVMFTSKDIEQIGHFKLIIGSFCKIGFTRNTRSEAFRITISDVQFYDWLMSIGLTPHKSLTISAEMNYGSNLLKEETGNDTSSKRGLELYSLNEYVRAFHQHAVSKYKLSKC